MRKYGTGEVLKPEPEDEQGLAREASNKTQTPRDREELAKETKEK